MVHYNNQNRRISAKVGRWGKEVSTALPGLMDSAILGMAFLEANIIIKNNQVCG